MEIVDVDEVRTLMGESVTKAEDFGEWYYAHGCGLEYDPRSEYWIGFFDGIAERLTSLFHPETALDAGCAKGILVGSMASRGVDACGVDISDTAIADGDPRAEGRLRVASLVEPIDGHYDLVTCIEVIEHMTQREAEVALDNLCAVTDLLVLSSSPWDLKEATHINVRPAGHWAAMFLDRGFVRRFDIDLDFITPWAAAYQRRDVAPRELVREYESEVATMRSEVFDKRNALLEVSRQLAAVSPDALSSLEEQRSSDLARISELERELSEAKLALEAVMRRADSHEREARLLQDEVGRLRTVLHEVYASRTWQSGRALAAPVRVAKRMLGRGA